MKASKRDKNEIRLMKKADKQDCLMAVKKTTINQQN
jgi:hypothetical protein